jgi:hypothetical protein
VERCPANVPPVNAIAFPVTGNIHGERDQILSAKDMGGTKLSGRAVFNPAFECEQSAHTQAQ